MTIKVLSATKTIFSGEIKLARFMGVDGSFTVLNNHAPMVAKLKEGNIICVEKDSSKEKIVEVSGGLVRVLDNEILVLTE